MNVMKALVLLCSICVAHAADSEGAPDYESLVNGIGTKFAQAVKDGKPFYEADVFLVEGDDLRDVEAALGDLVPERDRGLDDGKMNQEAKHIVGGFHSSHESAMLAIAKLYPEVEIPLGKCQYLGCAFALDRKLVTKQGIGLINFNLVFRLNDEKARILTIHGSGFVLADRIVVQRISPTWIVR